jgi:ubiquinone/menaquinone biosynthesis C-methylase UbiE
MYARTAALWLQGGHSTIIRETTSSRTLGVPAMAAPTSSIFMRVAYGVTQLPRVAWYLGHGLALRRLAEAARQSNGAKARRRIHTNAPVPDRSRLYADMARLFLQDVANVESGIYPLPADHDGSLVTLINRSRLFFEDLPEIHRRRERRANNEIFNKDTRGTRPRYYLQNFHFQSGGWLTDESAERYDTQVEVLLNGTANAMRRQALPQLHETFAGRDQRQLRLLDIGSGTGRFLGFVKQTWPRLHVVGLDMSDAYVRHAKRHLRHRSRTSFVVGKAEAIPLADNSQDAVTSIFLFHELPPRVRRSALRECARVLKPGGRLILLDSLHAMINRIMTACYSCSHKIITNPTMQVTQRKISGHSPGSVVLPMYET